MNMQRLRKEAETVIANDQFRTRYGGGTTDGVRLLEFATAVLALTDPTPLTVERLVERGGKKKLFISSERWPIFDFGTFRVIAEGDVDDWRWVDLGKLNWRINPAPRTVGELAMIELLMEGR